MKKLLTKEFDNIPENSFRLLLIFLLPAILFLLGEVCECHISINLALKYSAVCILVSLSLAAFVWARKAINLILLILILGWIIGIGLQVVNFKLGTLLAFIGSLSGIIFSVSVIWRWRNKQNKLYLYLISLIIIIQFIFLFLYSIFRIEYISITLMQVLNFVIAVLIAAFILILPNKFSEDKSLIIFLIIMSIKLFSFFSFVF